MLAAIAAATLATGCGGKDDALAKGERSGPSRPSLAEVKAISEEGFACGLPIVMSCAVLHACFVDPASGRYGAPMGQINSEARAVTPADAAVVTPNSDTPDPMLAMDLRAEPTVLSVPAVEKSRSCRVMLCDGNTCSFGYVGSRATSRT